MHVAAWWQALFSVCVPEVFRSVLLPPSGADYCESAAHQKTRSARGLAMFGGGLYLAKTPAAATGIFYFVNFVWEQYSMANFKGLRDFVWVNQAV